MPETIAFHLNGQPVSLSLDGSRKLLWVLRTELERTGTKYSCGRGLCGTCTVLVDDRPVRSCMLPVAGVAGKHVTTIEGLEKDGVLHPLQEAFIKHDALQCGFCTPGMIMTAHGLLRSAENLTRENVIAGMEANLCRCGAHPRIIDAILEAAGKSAAPANR